MTRPPNRRVSRGQPVRRGAPAKKGSSCPAMLLIIVLLFPLVLIYALVASLLPTSRRRNCPAAVGAGLTGAAVLRGAAAPGRLPVAVLAIQDRDGG